MPEVMYNKSNIILHDKFLNTYSIKWRQLALAGVDQWSECQPANQRVAGLIPSLGHMPELQVSSTVGGTQEATTH